MVAEPESVLVGMEILPGHSLSSRLLTVGLQDHRATGPQTVVKISVDSGVVAKPTEKQQWSDNMAILRKAEFKCNLEGEGWHATVTIPSTKL